MNLFLLSTVWQFSPYTHAIYMVCIGNRALHCRVLDHAATYVVACIPWSITVSCVFGHTDTHRNFWRSTYTLPSCAFPSETYSTYSTVSETRALDCYRGSTLTPLHACFQKRAELLACSDSINCGSHINILCFQLVVWCRATRLPYIMAYIT